MPAFIGPPDPVAILQDLLERALKGDIEIGHIQHQAVVGQPACIIIELVDLSGTKMWHRIVTPPSVKLNTGPLSNALTQGLLALDMMLPKGKPIEELGVTTEPIVGYRDFLIDGTLDEIVLLSRNQTEWPKFKPLIATCVEGEDNITHALRSHDAPEISCSCGIYSFDTPKHEDMDFSCDVWGEIYGWGETYICDSGYRTEFAYPKSIFIRSYGTKTADRVAEAIRQQYGVPVYVVATRDGLTEGDMLEQMIQGIGGDTNNDDSTT